MRNVAIVQNGRRNPSALKVAAKKMLRTRWPAGFRAYGRAKLAWHTILARRNRKLIGTYIGVTGSCGKSTVTYLASQLLQNEGSVRSVVQRNTRPAAFGNMAQLRSPIDFFVQEMSGHRPGVIERMTRVVRPDIAVVTAVGQDHFANFRDLVPKGDGEIPVADRLLSVIAEEKGSLVAALGPQGIACLDADKPLVRAMATRARGRVILFGTSPDAEVRAENVTARWPDRLSFDLIVDGNRHPVATRFVGTLALNSILGALAVVRAAGGDVKRAADTLADLEPFRSRMSIGTRAGRPHLCDRHGEGALVAGADADRGPADDPLRSPRLRAGRGLGYQE